MPATLSPKVKDFQLRGTKNYLEFNEKQYGIFAPQQKLHAVENSANSALQL
jgi:hypothetical protein